MIKRKLFYGILAFALFIMFNATAMADVQRSDLTDDDDVVYTAVPDNGKCGDDMVWDLDADGLLTISGSGSMYEYYNQESVPWFRNNNSKAITGVEFSGNVETISNMAFYGTRIRSIELPQSVKEIGYSAIANCRLLESVILPDRMETITRYAFNCDISLAYVHLPENLQSIGQDAFMGCHSLENIKIPDSVSVIDKLAFDDCMNLKKIVLPEKITSVKEGTFSICDNLTEVFFSKNLKTIEKDAFADCFSLKKIILPDGLESIGEYAFNSSETSGEQTIYIPESVKTISKRAINRDIATIYGFKNSAAEKYAKENNIPFVAVTESMYSEEEYKSALNGQIETVPEMPVQKLTPPAKKKSVTLPASAATAYSDCDNPSVTALTNIGVLSGDGDGKFRPDDLLTRAEFSTMVSRVTGIDDMMSSDFPDESQFSDIAHDHWAFESITFCSDNTFIDGYDDGTFRPNENISIAQAVKICLSAVGYNNIIEQDNDVWYKPWIDTAYDYSLIDSKTDNPDRLISRQEAAELIYRTINMPLCVVTGFDFSDGTVVPSFRLCDGTTDEDGETMELETLYTRYVK